MKNPRRSNTATASTVARSNRRAAPSHSVITDSNSASAPDSTTPAGAKALAALLENHQVEVTGTTTYQDAVDGSADKTLLIALRQ